MNAECKKIQSGLIEVACGNACDKKTRSSVEDHIEWCDECRTYFIEVLAIKDRYQSEERPEPDWDRIWRRIRTAIPEAEDQVTIESEYTRSDPDKVFDENHNLTPPDLHSVSSARHSKPSGRIGYQNSSGRLS